MILLFSSIVSVYRSWTESSFLLQFEKAAGEVLSGLKMREAKEGGEMEEPLPKDVQILLTSREDPVSMRLLGVCVCF